MVTPNPNFEEQSSATATSDQTPFDVVDKMSITDDGVSGFAQTVGPVNGHELLATHAYLGEGVNVRDVPLPPNPDITVRDSTLLETAGVIPAPLAGPNNQAAQIPPREDVEKSDFDILNERLDEQMAMIRHQEMILLSYGKGIEYLCNSMQWLTNMMSGVAEVAQKMPGMGGMMARMLAPKEAKGNQG